MINMIKEWLSSRSNVLLTFIFFLLVLLGVRLFVIIGVQGDVLAAEADTNTIKSIKTDSPRGSIYDRNGVLLAGNKPIFTVSFARNGMSAEKVNESLIKLITILDDHAEKYDDTFPILLNEDGTFSFTYERDVANWLVSKGMSPDTTAEEAFNDIRERNSIDPELDVYEAQELLVEIGDNPPIALATMEYRAIEEKRAFYERFEADESLNAEELFNHILTFYGIDKFDDISLDTKRKMATIRNELTLQGYLQYIPVKVAQDLKKETVIKIQEQEHDLIGCSVNTETVRYYPYDESASQIIGYLGKISDANKKEYIGEKGYAADDMIGLAGIELAMEETLHGTDGLKRVQVDTAGNTIRDIGEEIKPNKGKDVVLTIDYRLQKIAEDALEKNLRAVRGGGLFTSEFGDTVVEKNSNAEVGAAIVVNVKTGEPLAIADTNKVDPNRFAEGISEEDWQSYQPENPRDPMAPRPLYSTALKTAVQPGSTFKPLTAITALESGLDPNRHVMDKKYLEYGDYTFSCMGSHGYVNLFTGLQYSCNYYFYDIATGRDWASGGVDLGYKDNIDVEKISQFAMEFGLGVETGIELSEEIGTHPSAENKMKSTKSMLRNYLISQSEYIFEQDILDDYEKLSKNIDDIVSWTEENPGLSDLKSRLENVGIKEAESDNLSRTVKSTYYNFAEWSMADVFNLAIGQGENAFTPMQMARYTATIANGGTLNSASIIKAQEGVGEVERPAGVKTSVSDPKYLEYIAEGMNLVVRGGSMSGINNLGIKMAGKTGTAQRSGYVNPPNEVEYIKDNLSKINSDLTWAQVEEEMHRIMSKYPEIYDTNDKAVRKAVANLSGRNFNTENMDRFKDTYDDFAWNIVFAPADDPEIAVVVLLVQGGSSSNALPATKEIVGQYFKLKEEDEESGFSIDYNSFFDKDNRENSLENVFSSETSSGEAISGGATSDGDDSDGENSGGSGQENGTMKKEPVDRQREDDD